MSRLRHPSASRGFTLIEAIAVIVITGIIAAMIAVFLRAPVDGYLDAARRAELTDVADTSVRRLARDVRLALPNSVRNPADGSDQCVEFIPTKIGARYRALSDSTGSGDPLDFTAVDGAFDMLWLNNDLPAANRVAVGDVVAVFNDGSASGDAYTGSNAIQIAGLTPDVPGKTTNIAFVDTATATPFNRKQLGAESPARRFSVIPAGEHVVAYACSGGVLRRYSRTLTAAWAQPMDCAAMVGGATSSRLAQAANMTCSLKYDPPGSSTGLSDNGILSISLVLGDAAGESVKLYHQIQVNNTP